MHRDNELLSELMVAVYLGDIAAAEKALETIKFAGPRWMAEMAMEARRTVRPPRAGVRDPNPLILPQGKPGTFLGGSAR